MKPTVFITQLIPQPGIDLLKEHFSVEVNPKNLPLPKKELLRRVKGKEAVLSLLTDVMDDEVMAAAGSNLKIIANYAVGFNNIDLVAATQRGIPVTNTPDVLTDATADFAWTLLMASARRITEGDKLTRSGKFKGWGALMLLGADVFGKTLGIVGLGRIGVGVAKRAKGFNMRILYNDAERVSSAIEQEAGVEFVPLERLLRESDFVSLHVPLMEGTRHLMGEREFSMMKKTAHLINTSRGPVINEKALVAALRSGKIAGAALDVYENEPKLATGLAKLPNCVLAPHIASATIETRTKMALMAAENIVARLSGRRPPNCVNPEVL